MKKLFSSLEFNADIKSRVLANLEQLGFKQMTPIQEESLPLILQGHDVIAQAKTGSGKTAAFGLGLLNKLTVDSLLLQSLVLCPTRELAEQVAEELRRLARFTQNIKIMTICGGASEYKQAMSLDRGTHIIVGTPGRVLRMLKTRDINLETIDFLVLDEADRMLDMGFREDMDEILSHVPKNIQALLFSATFPEEIESLSESFQNNPKRVVVESIHEENVIDQVFYELEGHPQKMDALTRVLSEFKPESVVIFCKTKQICGEVAKFLQRRGISSLAFHGDLEQNERTCVLTKFSNKSCRVLVATDVAARGLDIKDLSAVINFDMASDAEVHTHRIGRTARAGNVGLAFTFFVSQENEKVDQIEEYQGRAVKRLTVDDLKNETDFDLEAPMKTMYINGGKKDKVRAGDILGALVKEAGVNADDVGSITILDNQSYVAIKKDLISHVIHQLLNGKIKGRRFKVGLA